MSGSRSTKPRAPAHASIEPFDNFGRVYVSMARSGIYKALSTPAKQLYTICTVHAASSEGRRAFHEYQNAEGALPEKCFVFPSKHIELYGLTRSTFQKYMGELIAAGFVDVIAQNKHRRKMNVYAFSDKWKNSS